MSYYATIIALLLFSCIFLALPLPKKGKEMANYSTSLKFLSASYAALGIFGIFKQDLPLDIIGLPFFINATTQNHLLCSAHLSMINPKAITLRRFAILVAPAIIIGLVGGALYIFYGTHRITNYEDLLHHLFVLRSPDIIVRAVGLTYFLLLCGHYIAHFYKEVASAKVRINDYTSEAHVRGLLYIRISFLIVILIGVLSICQTFSFNEDICGVLNFSILCAYICLGLFFIQYPKNYYLLKVSGMDEEMKPAETADSQESIDDKECWPQWKSKIIDEELYTQVGITIVQLAQQLNTNRTTLSAAINKNEDANFNTFINRLRIDKARDLMEKEPDLTLTDICLQVGYTDQSNFSRSFKCITGCTPLYWRKNHNGKA